jgi:sulfonate transport system substrate-binding protein
MTPGMDLTRRAVLGSALAAAVAGCTHGAAPLAIGYQKSGLLPLARARGTIDAALHAIGRPSAQWTEFPSGPPMLEAIGSAAVDFGAVGESPPIFAQAAGAAIRYVAAQPSTGHNSAILVAAGSPIRTVADLRGRRVAFTRASSAHLVLAKALRGAGLGFADIVPVNLAPADAAGAFAGGAVDAWSIWDPFFALAVARSDARVLIGGDSLPPTAQFFIGSSRACQDKAADLRAIVGALHATGDWARGHLDAAANLTAGLTGLSPPIARIMLGRSDLAVEAVGPDLVRRQQANADLFADLGLIPARIDVAADVWGGAG